MSILANGIKTLECYCVNCETFFWVEATEASYHVVPICPTCGSNGWVKVARDVEIFETVAEEQKKPHPLGQG